MLLAAVWVARVRLGLQSGAPSGNDPGNWLYVGRSMFHLREDPLHLVYPPVVPTLATLSWIIGGGTGMVLCGVTIAVSPALAGFAMWRRFDGGSLAAALLLVVTPFGEAFAWGGWPTLLGIAALILSVGALDVLLSTWSLRNAAFFAGAVVLGLGTSHAVLLPLVAGLVVVGASHMWEAWWRKSARETFGYLVRAGMLCVAVAAPFAPMYLKLLSQVRSHVEDRLDVSKPTIADLLASQASIFSSYTRFLWLALITGGALIVIAKFRTSSAIWVQAAAFWASAPLFLVLKEERFRFFIPVAIVASLAVLVSANKGFAKGLAYALVAGVLVVETLAASHTAVSNRRFYQSIQAGTLESISWVEKNLPDNTVIATRADQRLSDGPWGWWVRGVTSKRVLVGTAPLWVNFATEKQDAMTSNNIYSYPLGSERQMRAARKAGVDVLIATYKDQEFTSAIEDSFRERVLFSNDVSVVLSTAAVVVNPDRRSGS